GWAELFWLGKCALFLKSKLSNYESKCYFFSTDTKTWTEANAYCIEQGSNLMSIQDIQERVRGFNTHDCKVKIFWIGLNDLVIEGVWEWSDGKYIRWNAGNPDDYFGEDCLSILINDGYWNDDNCQNKRGYICKRRGEECCLKCC
uniref:C-type lectin domain-containing protein n=1 Tax=Xiphophorus maculatus TaxID=8083 RepID=A0A3B5PWD5_XIPMA